MYFVITYTALKFINIQNKVNKLKKKDTQYLEYTHFMLQ